MAEKTTGLYKIVTSPSFYQLFQDILGGAHSRIALHQKYFADTDGKSVLELGCGPGSMYEMLSDCKSYTGIDWNAKHILRANKKYGAENVTFLSGDATSHPTLNRNKFDYVFAFGLIHHLDNEQTSELLASASACLAEGGKFIAVDPVFHEHQNPIARLLKKKDSGQHIRDASEYVRLLQLVFNDVQNFRETGLLRVPYSHSISVCMNIGPHS